MDRLIYADKLIADIDEIRYECIGMRGGTVVLSAFAKKYRDDILQTIANQPTVDAVEVVHGEWIKTDSMPRSAKCSECNCWITRHTINENWFRFCPNCGAKMDGGDKE